VDLFEYQARDLFEKHGVPVLSGAVATTDDEAFKAASALGGKVVVKAQVKVGGRGKAGGVKLAVDADDAKAKAGAILGMDIKGHTVHQVMIAQAAPIVDEYYISILLDRSNRTFLVMASVAGGMDIEEVAHTAPEKLAKVPTRPGCISLCLQSRAHRSKNWPQPFALLGAQPALAPHALNCDVIIERLDAPSINDVHPFGKQKAIRKALHIGGGSRSHDSVTKQRLRRDAWTDAKFELMQLVSDTLKGGGSDARNNGSGIGRKHGYLRCQCVSERLREARE
jgi:hypothetical protein